MADPTACNYYAQVDREIKEQMAADAQRIADGAREVARTELGYLLDLLERDFGRLAVRNMDVNELLAFLQGVAERGANIASGVALDTSLREAQRSAGSMLKAVLAGVQLGNREPHPAQEGT